MACQLLIEAQEWSPHTQLNVDPLAVLGAHNSVWMSALAAKSSELVGVIGAHNINWPDGSAELAVGVVPNWRGKGGAKVLADKLHEFCFKDLGLRRLTSTSLEGSPMAKTAAKCGLEVEGIHPKARLKNGEFVGTIDFVLWRDK